MSGNRLSTAMAGLAMAGLAACAGGEEVEGDATVIDTLVTPEIETVEVPVTVPDTALVTTDVDVDVDVDTVDVGPQ